MTGFEFYLADTVALACVAVIGYLFGRRSRPLAHCSTEPQLQQELVRASQIARELHQIADRIRGDVAAHQSNISQFNARIGTLQKDSTVEGWHKLSSEAESLLLPTMKLATDLSLAYDQLRKHSLQLMNFAGSRTDPTTGIHNRRSMNEQMEVLFALHQQNATRFSLALFSVELVEGEANEQSLSDLVECLKTCARDTDVVARYSTDEFAVLMPQTSLEGAIIFSERLMRRVLNWKTMTVAGGIAEVQTGDDSQKILSRADSALYSARANGYTCLCKYTGKTIREHEFSAQTRQNPPSEDTVVCANEDTVGHFDKLVEAVETAVECNS